VPFSLAADLDLQGIPGRQPYLMLNGIGRGYAGFFAVVILGNTIILFF
jgi:hypothetical protein